MHGTSSPTLGRGSASSKPPLPRCVCCSKTLSAMPSFNKDLCQDKGDRMASESDFRGSGWPCPCEVSVQLRKTGRRLRCGWVFQRAQGSRQWGRWLMLRPCCCTVKLAIRRPNCHTTQAQRSTPNVRKEQRQATLVNSVYYLVGFGKGMDTSTARWARFATKASQCVAGTSLSATLAVVPTYLKGEVPHESSNPHGKVPPPLQFVKGVWMSLIPIVTATEV